MSHVPNENPPGGSANPETIRILIVDDEDDIRTALKQSLSRLRWHKAIQATGDAQEALRLVRTEPWNLVISDYNLGAQVTGVDILSAVMENNEDAVRVLITAYQDLQLAVRAINESRIDAYIQKPWTLRDLLDQLDNLISKQQEDLRRQRAMAKAVSFAARVRKPGP